MRNRLLIAATAAVFGAATLVGVAVATSAAGVTSTTFASGRLGEVNLLVKTGDWKLQLRTKGDSDVQVVENRVAPGGTFGWHSHPGPSLIVVKSGTMTFYRGDDPSCSPLPYGVGQALIDPGNEVHIGRNEGPVDAVVIVTRFVPVGAAPRVDKPAPGTCGF
jgi:quercetin dioxygenase-like cupin family protein